MYNWYMQNEQIAQGSKILLLQKEKPRNVNHHYVTSVFMAIVATWWLTVQEYLWLEEAIGVTSVLIGYLIIFFEYKMIKCEAKTRNQEIRAMVKYHLLCVILFVLGCMESLQIMILTSMVVLIVPLIFYGAQMTLVSVWCREEKFPEWLRKISFILCHVLTYVPVGVLLAMMLLSRITVFALAIPLWGIYLCAGMPLIALKEYETENLFEFAFEMTY